MSREEAKWHLISISFDISFLIPVSPLTNLTCRISAPASTLKFISFFLLKHNSPKALTSRLRMMNVQSFALIALATVQQSFAECPEGWNTFAWDPDYLIGYANFLFEEEIHGQYFDVIIAEASTVVFGPLDKISAHRARDGSGFVDLGPRLYDTSRASSTGTPGEDPDLDAADIGPVLIVQQTLPAGVDDGAEAPADDNQNGGTIRFDFDKPLYLDSVTLVDTEEAAVVTAKSNGEKKYRERSPKSADGEVVTVDIDQDEIDILLVRFRGSGGFRGYTFCKPPPPLPWINEIQFFPAGERESDPLGGYCVELAGPAGLNLRDVDLYVTYINHEPREISAGPEDDDHRNPDNYIFPDQENGFGTLVFCSGFNDIFSPPTPEGQPAGFVIALRGLDFVDRLRVMEFVTVNGEHFWPGYPPDLPLDVTSQDAGPLTFDKAHSVVLTGTGNKPGDFTWSGPVPSTLGELNVGQVIV